MMLEYEWGNPAAAAAAMMLFGEETAGQETGQDRAFSLFDHYSGHHHHHHSVGDGGGGGGCDLFPLPQPTPLTAAALFSPLSSSPMTSCHPRYGLPLPPAPTRIGLNLGVRTYFSSASPDSADMVVRGRAPRRRTRTARCQAEGCGADLTHAKHYHRRHKVCEFHSKASIVIAAGLSQRFCQQCSRFHVLSEFDQGKRSCRKRLADHNRRRRKSQDLSTPTFATNAATNNDNDSNTAAADSVEPKRVLFAPTSNCTNNNDNNRSTTPTSVFPGCKPETESSVTHVSSPPAVPPPHAPLPAATQMMLGLGCGVGIAAAPAGMSASSSPGNSPPSVSFLSHLGDFRGNEHRFSGWDETEDGSSVKGLYQSK